MEGTLALAIPLSKSELPSAILLLECLKVAGVAFCWPSEGNRGRFVGDFPANERAQYAVIALIIKPHHTVL